jgi:membrane fusion protein, multidrug efflux system
MIASDPVRITMRSAMLGLLALALANCDGSAEQASNPAQMVKVQAAAITSYQPVAKISGDVQARIQTDLGFRITGKVIARQVDVGSHVRTGDVLMQLDDTEQRADVAIAEASLRSAQADLKQKSLAFERNKTLLSTRAVAQQVLDQAQQDLITAKSALQSAEASLETARDSLSYTVLRADYDGIITARNVEIGTVVSAAQTAMTIAHDGQRDAVFDIYEAFFLTGEPAKEVQIAPINDPAQQVTATIREVSPVIASSTGTIRVKLTLPPEADWPLGTSLTGAFQAPPKTGMVFPWSAMSSQNGEPAVWVVDPQSRTAKLRPVTVALYRANDFIISDGVNAGDLVVTDGGKLLRPDAILDWKGR